MSCTADVPCEFRQVPLEQIDVRWDGPAVGRKALAFPKRRVIYLDSAFWRSIPTVQGRAGLLAHERGHIEGACCESCADVRAGEILRREGWATARDAQVTALSRLENRDATAAAADLGKAFGAGGHVDNFDRSAGVNDELTMFLNELDGTGLEYAGRIWRITVGVDGGRRVDAKQLQLWAKGRKQQPDGSWVIVDQGQVVTYARTAAETKHGRGEALDLWVLDQHDEPILYERDAAAAGVDFEGVYQALGERGEARGLQWGGRWSKLKDRPHFESTTSPVSRLVSAVTGSPTEPPGDEEVGDVVAPPLVSADDFGPGLAVAAAVLAVVCAALLV